ncbi:hypothetical protein AVEN_207895-1 [Araneus ventricosus]|uniref:Uncharacterized protein n=1 Tax=Araneus ventricosus TaxID=182803 RepID=A0A4Y2LXA8_ARAVE|nr:hypothetical protein AVEN_207895-1 [Araneus ventricosus]
MERWCHFPASKTNLLSHAMIGTRKTMNPPVLMIATFTDASKLIAKLLRSFNSFEIAFLLNISVNQTEKATKLLNCLVAAAVKPTDVYASLLIDSIVA